MPGEMEGAPTARLSPPLPMPPGTSRRGYPPPVSITEIGLPRVTSNPAATCGARAAASSSACWRACSTRLILEYEAQVDKGDLTIAVSHEENEALWEVSLREDAKDTVELTLEQDGPYALTIEGDNAGGSFDLSWEVK